jgi:hypothetical protein
MLQTDTSDVALGAALLQDFERVPRPIAYASRTQSSQGRKASSIYELKCLAVLFVADKFRKFIEHQEFFTRD